MKYTEELLWILDKPGTTLQNQHEKYQENIAFVHSLGLKCDSVGWCKLDLSDPRAPEILDKISAFCQKNGWTARGLYARQYIDVESDWYELVPAYFKDNTPSDQIETVAENSEKIHTRVIRAYHEMSPTPKKWGEELFVPERFRDFCIQSKCNDLDFCWAKDKGKYEAEQYFHVYGKQLVSEIAVAFDLSESNQQRIAAAGGWLPEIAGIFYKLQQINLPDCYFAKDMPEDGIAYAYIPSTFSCVGRHTILIQKNIVQTLLQQRIVPPSALRPVPIVDELPGGYVLKRTQPIARPVQTFMAKMLLEYEQLKNADRPARMVSEKEASKLLRIAKKERKEDFKKAMPKIKRQDLLETDYRPMAPYYSVANGGFLSDEYELLPYAHAAAENDAFHKSLESEELLETKPDGIVIAKCPDGDSVLLCKNDIVIRFSHEATEIIEQWPSLEQFIVDSIND